MANKHQEYLQKVTDRLVQQIQENKAPWQKPWAAGDYTGSMIPINSKGKPYNGMNMINLMSIADERGYTDNRWLTFNGAKEAGAKVRKGERASDIYYWKFTDTITGTKKDIDGNEILDDKGKPQKIKIEVKLEKPRVFFAQVFNAEQIDGLPPIEATVKKLEEWERHEAAERILQASGVPIIHKAGERAFYSPNSDKITLPERSQFASADLYYATALHELGHATGHESRLNRDLSGGFGSVQYAKEELRAEIASMMIGQELQIGHDPSQHIAYLQSWAKIVKDDPKEIFKAVKDADAIHQFVLSLDPERVKDEIKKAPALDKVQNQDHPNEVGNIFPEEISPEESKNKNQSEISNTKIFLNVPFAEKNEVKALGGKWDKVNQSWYVPDDVDQTKFSKWMDVAAASEKTDKTAPMGEKARKTYLYTIPSDKDEVKALGAKYNADQQVWYVPNDTDVSKFEKWLNRPEVPSPEQAFSDHLKGMDIVVESGHPKMDGKAYRLANDQSDAKNVLYQLYPNHGGVPSGRVTNFSRDGIPEKWTYPTEYLQKQQNIEAVDKLNYGADYQAPVKPVLPSEPSPIAPVDRQEAYNDTADRTKALFEIAPVAQNHEYLERKQVTANNVVRIVPDADALPDSLKSSITIANNWKDAIALREDNPENKMIVQKGSLIIPQYNKEGELRSFETIGYNGAKYALKDGEKNGLSLHLGKVEDGKPFILTEGYATGATLHEQATNKIPVVVAFGKNNLEDLALDLREKHPNSRIYFAADNDFKQEAKNEINVGIANAANAAHRVNGYLLIPDFYKADVGKDWNDIFVNSGGEELRRQLTNKIESNNLNYINYNDNKVALSFGMVENNKPLLISNDYMTAKSLFEQTKQPVILLFEKSEKIPEIAAEFREKYQDSRIYFAANNDHKSEALGKGNAGIEDATKAADAVNGFVLVPPFESHEDGKNWNDYFVAHGGAVFREQLKLQLDRIRDALGKSEITKIDLSNFGNLNHMQQKHILNFVEVMQERFKNKPEKLQQAMQQLEAKIPDIANGTISLPILETTRENAQEKGLAR